MLTDLHLSLQVGLSNKQIHVRIGLGTEESTATYSTGEGEAEGNIDAPPAIEDDPLPDVLLRVRERVASPPPPPHVCDRANKLSDVKHFTSTWLSVSAKNIEYGFILIQSMGSITIIYILLYCTIYISSVSADIVYKLVRH